ncbi:MAG: hypothetical protein CMO55_17575 [Verrucomicrobiales bacterium]|nr:hypothetical protein [Verrucomicrobiales bacterium]
MKKLILFAVAFVMMGGIVSNSYAGLPEHMRKVATKQDAEKITTGKVAMACSKCQSIQVREVDEKKSFAEWFKSGTDHGCPGCGGKIKVTHVSAKTGQPHKVVHTCSECGDDSAYCCSTTPGKKTPGMDKKKK